MILLSIICRNAAGAGFRRSGLPGAVIALGDSSYDVFCGGGEQMRELLLELGVREVLPMLRLDASESVTPDEDAKPWLAELALALKA